MKILSIRNQWISVMVIVLMSGVTLALALADENEKKWNFDDDKVGVVPKGFVAEKGSWAVIKDDSAPSKPNVFAQQAKNERSVFNITVVNDSNYKDMELAVKFKAVAGNIDQGGGLVWRYKDIKNYYITRYNPLEENLRVYKVQDSKRIQLQSAVVKAEPGWHTLKVGMEGNNIEVYYNGKEYLKVKDNTFKEAGKIGLWTKADAVTYFDDLSIESK